MSRALSVDDRAPAERLPPCGRPIECAKRRLPTLIGYLVAVASTLVITLAGCASTEGIASHAEPLAPQAVGLVPQPPEARAEPPLAADWWTAFEDPALSALVERALADSPTLKASQARVERAAALVGGAAAARAPQVNGALDVTRQRFSENGIYPPPLAGSTQDLSSLQASGGWDLDLFGRNRAALEAAIGAERAAEADAAAARVLLSSNVARTYVNLARLVEQRTVVQRSLAQRDELLGLIRQRVQAGLDTNLELRQGEGALPETRQQIEALDEQITLARHALAALTVQPPTALDHLTPTLAGLQAAALPEALPADLLGRRPDLAAARWRIEAATHEVAAAKAQFYPNVNLSAFIGLSSIGLDRLLRSGSLQYGAGPAVHLPIFDAGRLRAGLQGRASELDLAVENYNGAVIDAVHEAVDQLGSLRSIERQRREQASAAQSAESAYDLATQRYRAGLATYLSVLTAETSVLNQRRLGADLAARALDARFALIRALGGGYQATAADEPSAASRRTARAGS
jgi:NodT family efflux transporter outer membrane factor (OMF) lipoprotein